MTLVELETRLRSIVFGTMTLGVLVLTISVGWLAASRLALAADRTPPLFGKRNESTLQLPSGIHPADVVRMVQRSRELSGERGSVNDLRDNLPMTLDGEVGSPFQIGGEPVYGPAFDDQDYPAVAFDGTNYLVVWQDNRAGSEYDIYGARVSLSGNVLDPGGIAISSTASDQKYPAVVFDGTDYFVVWSDSRSPNPGTYGARVTVDGSVLDPDGILISNGGGCPSIAFDGMNCLVVWGYGDIHGARVTTEGAVLDTAGIAISTAPDSTAPDVEKCPSIAFDGTNYLVVWEDWRSLSSVDIYGARVTTEGAVLDTAGIAISTVPDTTAPDVEKCPSIAFDGTNYLVVWEDWRSLSSADIYGARVTTDGAVLDTAGIPISIGAEDQKCPKVAFDGTDYLVLWEGGSTTQGARVSTDGIVLDQDGIVISAEHSPRNLAIVSSGTDYLAVWGDGDIYGARVGGDGSVLAPDVVTISTAVGDQLGPKIAFDGLNYLVVWAEWRRGSFGVYGARVTVGGEVLDSTGIAIATAAYDQKYPNVGFDGTNYFVVWQVGDASIHGARVTTGGVVLDTAGIVISTAPDSTASNVEEYPAVAFDGANYLVVWDEYWPPVPETSRKLTVHEQGTRSSDDYSNDRPSGIYGARVGVDGSVLDRILISTGDARYSEVASDGTEYLVVWQGWGGDSGNDIYGARVAADGTVLDTASIAISTAPDYQYEPALAFDGANYLVVWMDYRSGSNYGIYGARVSTSGTVLDTAGIAISPSGHDEMYPAIAFDGANCLVVWEDRGVMGICRVRVDEGGSVLDSIPQVVGTAGYGVLPAVARGLSDNLLIVYGSYTSAPYYAYRIWGTRSGDQVGVPVTPPRPASFALHQNYPNPFNPLCTIRYDIVHPGKARLRVFGLNGSVVRTLVDAWREPGVYLEVWDGRDDVGRGLPSGVYFYRLEAGNFVATKKMVLLK